MDRSTLILYAITDSQEKLAMPVAQAVEEAILGGATIIQLREKYLTGETLEKEAREVLGVCRRHGIPLLINDDVALAAGIGADGVHLGQDDMPLEEARRILGPQAIIGITAKTIPLALAAQRGGADYIGSGAVFGTKTKADARPMDHDTFQSICEAVTIPVVAIGGIEAGNLETLRGRGMSGFAIVGGIFHQPDIKKAAEELKTIAVRTLS